MENLVNACREFAATSPASTLSWGDLLFMAMLMITSIIGQLTVAHFAAPYIGRALMRLHERYLFWKYPELTPAQEAELD